jgi:uncharacterized membrane protein
LINNNFKYWHNTCNRQCDRRNAGINQPNIEVSNMSHRKNAVIATAISSALALAGLLAQSASAADEAAKEKCYGVAQSGKNDCAANGHACAGQSKSASNGGEWIYVPTGTCERLVGGSLTAKPKG